MKIKSASLCIFLAAATLNLSAQSADDERALRQRVVEGDAAWNNHDAQQLTNPTNTKMDADFVNVYGGWTKGQENFVPMMTRLQAGPFHNVRRSTTVEKIRFIRPDVAVVIVKGVDRPADGPPVETRATSVWSKEGGRWLLNSFQNTQITAPPGPPPGPQGAPGSPHP